MVYFTLWPWYTRRLSIQDNQSYLSTVSDVDTCGDNLRPSRDEVAALACAMLDSMWYEWLSINDEQPYTDSKIFPVS